MIDTRLLIVLGALVVLIDAGVLIYHLVERRRRRPSGARLFDVPATQNHR